jgi:hypothetical protein
MVKSAKWHELSPGCGKQMTNEQDCLSATPQSSAVWNDGGTNCTTSDFQIELHFMHYNFARIHTRRREKQIQHVVFPGVRHAIGYSERQVCPAGGG